MKDTAITKTCDKDGTKMEWNPKKSQFICPKCGAVKVNTSNDILSHWAKY